MACDAYVPHKKNTLLAVKKQFKKKPILIRTEYELNILTMVILIFKNILFIKKKKLILLS